MMPMLTPQGLQIGVVNINNKTIRIMKMNLNNPAFLQMAGNAQAKEYISFVASSGSPRIPILSAIGDVTVVSTYNGVETTQLLTSPNEKSVSVQSDPNTQVFLYGKITKFVCDPRQGQLNITTLNVTKAKSLTYLSCSSNQLTSLDVSANTALTSLSCSNNVNITAIQSVAVNSNVANSIANLISDATSVDGTVTLRQGDEFNQTIIDAAMDKGWDVQYYS